MDIEIGTDLVHINMFLTRTGVHELSDILTDSELRNNISKESRAGIFAAKEAFIKAHGKKVDWQDIWIEKNKDGKPFLHSSLLSPEDVVRVSISHDGHYAVATVLIIKNSLPYIDR